MLADAGTSDFYSFSGITARESVSIPLNGTFSAGINNGGIELFTRMDPGNGARVDLGIMALSSPPESLLLARRTRDWHSETQSYSSQFVGASAEKRLSGGKTLLGYGGLSPHGEAVLGTRFVRPLSEQADLKLDLHVEGRSTFAGAFYEWSKTKDKTDHHFRSGLSLQDGNPVASAAYKAERKFDLGSHGYLRGQFLASAAVDRKHGVRKAAGLSVMKDITSFSLMGIPVTAEAGVSAGVESGRKPEIGLVWQLKI